MPFNTFPSNSQDGGGALSSGSSGQLRLAPDLDLPSRLTSSDPFETTSFDPSGSLTTALSLSGKWAISLLELRNLPTTEDVTIKLTVDGIVIWNDAFASSTTQRSIWGASGQEFGTFICKASLLLEVETVTDTSVQLRWIARPIL